MPGTDDSARGLPNGLPLDMSVSEWIWGIARDLPDCARSVHDAYGAATRHRRAP